MSGNQEQEVKEEQKPVEENATREAVAQPQESEAAEEASAGAEAAEEASAGTEELEDAAQKPDADKETKTVSGPDWKDAYARLLADFDNFKKRTARDRDDTYRFAESDILGDLLSTVDNLALALKNVKDPEDDFVKGVNLVYESFLAALKKHDAEPFDSKGAELDVEKMEAVATLPSDDVEEGKVSEEIKRGWMHKGRVLRAAQVVVSSGKKA